MPQLGYAYARTMTDALSKIRKPYHDYEDHCSRLYPVRQELHHYFRSRNSEGIPAGNREVGVQASVAQQASAFLHPYLP